MSLDFTSTLPRQASSEVILTYTTMDDPQYSDRHCERMRLSVTPENSPIKQKKPALEQTEQQSTKAFTTYQIASDEVENHVKYNKEAKAFIEPWMETLTDRLDATIIKSPQAVLKVGTRTETHVPAVGETGAGKSALISSLSSIAKLLPSGPVRNSCTATAIEVNQKSQDMTSRYRLKFDYISEREFVADINVVQRKLSAQEDDDEKENGQARGPHARLRAVFPGLTLDVLRSTPPKEILAQNTAKTALDSCVTLDFNKISDLKEELRSKVTNSGITQAQDLGNSEDEYVEGGEDNNWQHWPILEKVTLYLPIHLLEHGLVLCDHPGLGDQNAARNDRTLQSLATSTSICVITLCVRANDNSPHHNTLKPVIKDSIYNAVPRGIIVVCTKAEDVDIEGVVRELKFDVSIPD